MMHMLQRPSVNSSRGRESQYGGRKGSTRKAPLCDEQSAIKMLEMARLEPGIIWQYATGSAASSATVQKALDLVAASGQRQDAQVLIFGMCGRARQAYKSPSGNYVLSKIFEVMPTDLISCLAEELHGCALDVARHRFGCRCMLRLIRHHAMSGSEAVLAVIEELVAEVSRLGPAQFGIHVAEELLDSGLPEHRQAVARALKDSLNPKANHRLTKGLLKKAFDICDAECVISGHHA